MDSNTLDSGSNSVPVDSIVESDSELSSFDPFAPPEPTPARIVFEYAASEVKRREILVERCLSMALYWRQRTEFAYERLETAIAVAEQAAMACGNNSGAETAARAVGAKP